MLHFLFAESQRLLRSPKFVSKERFASPTSNGAALYLMHVILDLVASFSCSGISIIFVINDAKG